MEKSMNTMAGFPETSGLKIGKNKPSLIFIYATPMKGTAGLLS
jgi:hypothetical protein